MERIEIRELNEVYPRLAGEEVTVCGWIRTIRDSRTFGFIEINDGSCFRNLQVVFDDTLDNFSEIRRLNVGSALRVKGIVVETPRRSSLMRLRRPKSTLKGHRYRSIRFKEKAQL